MSLDGHAAKRHARSGRQVPRAAEDGSRGEPVERVSSISVAGRANGHETAATGKRSRRAGASAGSAAPSAASRDSYAVTALADVIDRSRPCGDGALHRRAFAGRARRRLPRLGDSPCRGSGQARPAHGKDRAQGDAPRSTMPSRAALGGASRALHRAAAAGPPLRRRRVAALAVQSHLPELPAHAAVVAQRHHRHSRRDPAARECRRVRRAAAARHALAVQLPRHQSGAAGAHDARRAA